MERRCKGDYKGMNDQGVVKQEDRISELPEDLIVQILSFLPTEVAIATSVLSKRWQLLWKKLQILHLNFVSSRCTVPDTRRMILNALSLNLRELVVQVRPEERFIVPKSLYKCEKLEILKLQCLVLKLVPSSVGLKNLRTLHLKHVNLQDKESFFNLLSGCHNLENLVVIALETARNTTLTISMPSLRKLRIRDYRWINDGYVINAPSLNYLKISGFKTFKVCQIDNLPNLEEAHIKNVYEDVTKNILGHLASTKRLYLELLDFKIMKSPTVSIFYQLTYLKLKVFYKEQRDLLTVMLDSSPKLQVLNLITDYRGDEKWNQPKKVPECLLFHLETFIWENFKWNREGDQMELVRYILGNTNNLKKAFIYTKAINPIKRVAMVNDLNSVIMASNSSCQLQFI